MTHGTKIRTNNKRDKYQNTTFLPIGRLCKRTFLLEGNYDYGSKKLQARFYIEKVRELEKEKAVSDKLGYRQ